MIETNGLRWPEMDTKWSFDAVQRSGSTFRSDPTVSTAAGHVFVNINKAFPPSAITLKFWLELARHVQHRRKFRLSFNEYLFTKASMRLKRSFRYHILFCAIR